MTNLQAMQDERLQDLIHQVEQLERLIRFADSDQYRTLCDEISELHREVKERWKELLMDWIYYDEPWYNPLIGKEVIAYRESGDKETRTLNLEYLCRGDVKFAEINANLVFDKGGEE